MTDHADCLVKAGNILGEGPLWHPEAERLFWFDILGKSMHACDADGGALRRWTFDNMVSAAGWVGRTTLLIASDVALFTFNTETGNTQTITDLEADNPDTRSNDGRADPYGGFWIGTMSLTRKVGAGAIYRYRRGELVTLMEDVTVPNSICFWLPDHIAYVTDSADGRIMRWKLDPETGDPVGEPDLFVDLSGQDFVPDGSIVDSEGCLWNAEYRSGRVVRYLPDGTQDRIIHVAAPQTTCPALGGRDLKRLFVTSANRQLGEEVLRNNPHSGGVFSIDVPVAGLPEPRVIL